MKAPAYWSQPGTPLGLMLSPLGWLYAAATARRLARAPKWRAPIPVVCVGNLTAGGAGKTPVVQDLTARLAQRAAHPVILSRGYGGRKRGPARVDPTRHSAADVGDEPLLLARAAPTWIAADRAAGARAIAAAGGAGLIVMDDGLQNPDLAQDLRLLVVDGPTGFGNGRCIPAGPLRESAAAGLARADAIIVMGEDFSGICAQIPADKKLLRARLRIADAPWLAGAKIIGFAGIGRPEKFRTSLTEANATIVGFRSFSDHHRYRTHELEALAADAKALDAKLVTTEKDWVRLTQAWRARIFPIPVSVVWEDEAAVDALLGELRHG